MAAPVKHNCSANLTELQEASCALRHNIILVASAVIEICYEISLSSHVSMPCRFSYVWWDLSLPEELIIDSGSLISWEAWKSQCVHSRVALWKSNTSNERIFFLLPLIQSFVKRTDAGCICFSSSTWKQSKINTQTKFHFIINQSKHRPTLKRLRENTRGVSRWKIFWHIILSKISRETSEFRN